MRISASPLRTVAIIAALAVVQAGAQPRKKQVKDQVEQDLYNQAIHADDPAARIEALAAWTARYSESDFKDDRLYFFIQAYSQANPPQPAKVIEYASGLVNRDLRRVFPTPEGGLVILNVLFLAVQSAASLPNASTEQLGVGRKAARDLLQFVGTYKPPDTTAEEWMAARADIEKRTQAAAILMVLAPGSQAMQKDPPDCAAAIGAYATAVNEFPQNAFVAWSLGKALHCAGRIPEAIFQFVRAGQIEPGEMADYATKLYVAHRGTDSGLDVVRDLAKRAPMPPPDFKIEAADEIAERKQAEFARDFPHLARWYGIRDQLNASYGVQYFEGQLKGVALTLKGTVIDGRPACRPKELLVAIGSDPRAEIALRLDSAPSGTAVRGEIEFTAVPRVLTKEPLIVTMDAERAKIVNLQIGPCAQP